MMLTALLVLYVLGVIIACTIAWSEVEQSHAEWLIAKRDSSFADTRQCARRFLLTALLAPVLVLVWPVVSIALTVQTLVTAAKEAW